MTAPQPSRAHLAVVEVSFHDATLTERERVAGAVRPRALVPLLASGDECVVLATCDRHAVYVAAADAAVAHRTRAAVSRLSGVPPQRFAVHRDRAAARHLMRVTMGLDAAILGEHEVQGQVGHAWRQARHAGAAGPVLARLFQTALHTAGRARARTGLGRGHVSLASVAVAELLALVPRPRTCVVVGTDPIARAVSRRLAGMPGTGVLQAGPRGAAAHLAGQLGTGALEGTPPEDTDAVVFAAPGPQVVRWLADGGRPGVVLDLCMPRAVSPADAVPGVALRNLEHLRPRTLEGWDRRGCDALAAERVASEGTTEMMDWVAGRVAAPAITALVAHVEALRERELRRALAGVDDPAARARLQRLSRRVTGALLHDAITALRRSPHPERDVEVLQRLWGSQM